MSLKDKHKAFMLPMDGLKSFENDRSSKTLWLWGNSSKASSHFWVGSLRHFPNLYNGTFVLVDPTTSLAHM